MSNQNYRRMKKLLFLLTLVGLLCCCQKKTTMETTQYAASEVIYPNEDKLDSMVVEIDMELPTKLPIDSLLLPIQQNILQQLYGKRFACMEPEEAMWAYIRMNQAEYLEMNKENLDMSNENETDDTTDSSDEEIDIRYTFCEENYISARVIERVGNILSYGIEQYVYMGGAHGIGTRFFYNYDLNTATLLNEDILFIDGYHEQLTALLRRNLVQQNEQLNSESDLLNSDYQQDNIIPNNNFAVQNNGISWHYNPYDIAPYAYGETDIFVAADDLKPLLREGIIIWE